MGNSEEYSYLGIKPFISYFNGLKIQSQLWTKDQLTSKQVNNFALWPHSIDLMIGGKKLALCHLANDVRIDFNINSTWSYQDAINYSDNPNKQFCYTNSNKQKEEIKINSNSNNPENLGFVSAKKDSLFNGKKVNIYDEIIQGHVHFKLLTEDEKTRFRTIRAVGMAYGMDPIDSASYVIIKEKEIGYDVEEILVSFDRNKMIESILKSDMPDKNTISKFVSYR